MWRSFSTNSASTWSSRTHCGFAATMCMPILRATSSEPVYSTNTPSFAKAPWMYATKLLLPEASIIWKRRTDMFSPNLAITALRSSSTNAFSSSTVAGFLATTVFATEFANATKPTSFATKSVSQFTSTNAPVLPSIANANTPSAAVRPANLPAFAPDLMRKISSAFSKLPSASTKAFLHSIMPKPVAARKSATIFAVISAIVFSNKFNHLKQAARNISGSLHISNYYSAAFAAATVSATA